MVCRGWLILRSLRKKGYFSYFVNREVSLNEFDSLVQQLWDRIKVASGSRQMSLDNIQNLKISKNIYDIAEGILNHRSHHMDAFSQHITYKKAWNVLVLALGQRESISRYVAMKAMLVAVPEICKTLIEESEKEKLIKTLLTIMSGDERKENRLKAIYLLGKIGFYLGSESGHEGVSTMAFKELSSKLILLQHDQRFLGVKFEDVKDTKIYLLHALGKFSRISNIYSVESAKYMDEIMFHVIQQEFELNGSNKIIAKSLLKILNSEINVTSKNKVVVGTLFLKHVNNLIRSDAEDVQSEAVEFASLWLPVESELAALMTARVQVSGLKLACDLVPEYKEKAYETDLRQLIAIKDKEEARLSKKSSLFRQLLNPPGTTSKLESITESPGFFVDTNSTLVYTSDIIINLPIDGDSFVSITRPLPAIPGVPFNATTVPTTFMDPTFAAEEPKPCSRYEAKERYGHIPGLPVGFTYSPGPFIAKQDLSSEYSPVPLSDDLADMKSSSIPRGFLKTCPNNTVPFNPNKFKNFDFDKNSPIKRENAVRRQTFDDLGKVPEHYTAERHPVLWPNDNNSLESQVPTTDFPVNAPVLFEIVEPGHKPIRFLTKVVSVGKDVSPIAVESNRSSSSSEANRFSLGSSFSIYIRPRGAAAGEWVSVSLEVVGFEYSEDVINSIKKTLEVRHVEPVPSGITLKGEHFFAPPVNFPPVPIGYTEEGIPFYSKTQSVKPLPSVMSKNGKRYYTNSRLKDLNRKNTNQIAGYDNFGQPFFLPPGCSLPTPVGYTEDGIPYYDIGTIVRQKGIIQIQRQKSLMTLEEENEDDEEEASEDGDGDSGDEENESGLSTPTGDGTTRRRRRKKKGGDKGAGVVKGEEFHRQAIFTKVLDSLKANKPEVKRAALEQKNIMLLKDKRLQRQTRTLGSESILSLEAELMKEPQLEDFIPPDTAEGILELFQETNIFLDSKSSNMKMHFEPPRIEFQSVRNPVTKSLFLKYKAIGNNPNQNNLDESTPAAPVEHDFFVSTKPGELFSVKTYQVRLQGEGSLEIPITYYPMAMRIDKTEGVLNVIDDSGKKLCFAKLIAFCQSFIKVTSKSLDFGWILPQKNKELKVSVENTSQNVIHLKLKIVSLGMKNTGGTTALVPTLGNADSGEDDKTGGDVEDSTILSLDKCPFHLLVEEIKLESQESKVIHVSFQPPMQGTYNYTLQIKAPGGEIQEIGLNGFCGIPLIMFPEPEISQEEGNEDDISTNGLSRERTAFVKEFLKKADSASVAERTSLLLPARGAPISGDDGRTERIKTELLKSIYYASSHHTNLEDAYCLDLGLIERNKSYMKRITLMNLSASAMTLAFHTHDGCISILEKVRVAAQTANTIEVKIDTSSTFLKVEQGEYRSSFEIVCPGFQNIPVIVKGFVGQALFIPLWNFVFFKPVFHGQSETIKSVIINQSPYDLSFTLEGVKKEDSSSSLGGTDKSFFSSVIGPITVSNSSGNSTGNSTGNNNASGLAATTFVDPCVTTTLIRGYSQLPISFKFKGLRRGPLMSKIKFKVTKPTTVELEATAFGSNSLYLIGLCLHPHSLSEGVNRNNLSFIKSWCGHPKRVLEEYPQSEEEMENLFLVSAAAAATGSNAMEYAPFNNSITFKFETIQFRPPARISLSEGRKPQIMNSLIQNKIRDPQNVFFISSACFNVDPPSRNLLGNDIGNLEIIYTPPQNAPDFLTVYGMVIASSENDNSLSFTQVIAKNRMDFIVTPVSHGLDEDIVLDFGHIENTSPILRTCSKTLVLCNPASNSMSWTIKFNNAKGGHTLPFEPMVYSGEIQGGESIPLTINFSVKSQGFYESVAEIYVRETAERNGKPQKAATIIMRGQFVPFVLQGAPEAIDFGNLLINRPRKTVFPLANKGSERCNVTIFCKDPFDVSPRAFTLDPDLKQDVSVSFLASESKAFSSKMQIFTGNVNYTVDLAGIGGTVDLICDKFDKREVNFGKYRDGTTAWMDIFLTNKGSLPLQIKALSAHDPIMIKAVFIQLASYNAVDMSNSVAFSNVVANIANGSSATSGNTTGTNGPNLATGKGTGAAAASSSNHSNQIQIAVIKKDFWKILKKKFRTVLALATLTNKNMATGGAAVPAAGSNISNFTHRPSSATRRTSRIMELKRATSVIGKTFLTGPDSQILIVKNESSALAPVFFGSCNLPVLKPMYSYHFRIGLCSPYQTKRSSVVNFHYIPILDEPEEDVYGLQQAVSLKLQGTLFRPLEFFPPFHDFGLAPAESFYVQSNKNKGTASYGVVKTAINNGTGPSTANSNSGVTFGNTLYISVTNPSMEQQSLVLKNISKGFTARERSWLCDPGSITKIAIEFHPIKAQTQYRGEAVFVHNYGENVIFLVGTGASADLTIDEEIDFGKAVINRRVTKTLTISNRGYLTSKYLLQLTQDSAAGATGPNASSQSASSNSFSLLDSSGGVSSRTSSINPDFKFVGDDPLEVDGVLESGASKKLEIECLVKKNNIPPGLAIFRYQTIVGGSWEEMRVPLKIKVGVPNFYLSNQIIDFATTFLNNKKTITIEIINSGTAECTWRCKTESTPFLKVEPKFGTLLDDSVQQLSITFQPLDYDPLNSVIYFETDVGMRTISCVGIVGVPYLKIEESDALVDFGIIETEKVHTKSISVSNTSTRILEYDITIRDPKSNGKEMPVTLFDHFFLTETHGSIFPKGTATIAFSARPHDYNVRIDATYCITSRDGEEVTGILTFIGGQAILDVIHHRPSSAANKKIPAGAIKVTLDNHLMLFKDLREQMREFRLPEATLTDLVKLSIMDKPLELANDLIETPLTIVIESTEGAKGELLELLVIPEGEKEEYVPLEFVNRLDKGLFKPSSRMVDLIRGSSKSLTISESVLATLNQMDESMNNVLQALSASLAPGLPEYELGLIRPNASTEKIKLFEIPNRGNMDINLKFIKMPDDDIYPATVSKALKKNYFSLTPPEVTLLPGSVLNVFASFNATEPGIYYSSYEMLGNERRLDVFRLHGKVGKSVIEWKPSSSQGQVLSFGLLPRNTRKTISVQVVNSGEFEEAFTIELPKEMMARRGNGKSVIGSKANLLATGSKANLISAKSSSKLISDEDDDDEDDEQEIIPKKGSTNALSATSNKGSNSILAKGSTNNLLGSNVALSSTSNQALGQATANLPFEINVLAGNLLPGESVPVAISFCPEVVGHFQISYPIKWIGKPCILNVQGDCGSPQIKVIVHEEEHGAGTLTSSAGGGVDDGVYVVFGNAFIGTTVSKRVTLYNAGKCPGELEIDLPSPQLKVFSLIKDAPPINMLKKKIELAAGDQIPLRLDLNCLFRENIEGNITINVKDYDKISFPVQALVGKAQYEVSPLSIDFGNMPINEEQEKSFNVCNQGDFEIPYRISLKGSSFCEDDDNGEGFESLCTVICDGEPNMGGVVKALDGVSKVTIRMTPTIPKLYVLKVTVIPAEDLSLKPTILESSFRAYDLQLQLSATEDETFERLDTGSKHIFTRDLINLGNLDLSVRVRLEFPAQEKEKAAAAVAASSAAVVDGKKNPGAGSPKLPGKKKKGGAATASTDTIASATGTAPETIVKPVIESTLFSLLSATEIVVPGNQSVPLEVQYVANDEWDDVLREAMVVLEFQKPSNAVPAPPVKAWQELARYRLLASTCRPKIVVTPEKLIDFENVSVNGSKSYPFTVENRGSGTIRYSIVLLPAAANNNAAACPFTIEPAELLSGEIPSWETLEFRMLFKPTSTGEYNNYSVQISTSIQNEVLAVRGRAAVMKIKTEELPKLLDFGSLLFGETKELKIPLINDCELPLLIKCEIVGELAGKDKYDEAEGFRLSPMGQFKLDGVSSGATSGSPSPTGKRSVSPNHTGTTSGKEKRTVTLKKCIHVPLLLTDDLATKNAPNLAFPLGDGTYVDLLKLDGMVAELSDSNSNAAKFKFVARIDGGPEMVIPITYCLRTLPVKLLLDEGNQPIIDGTINMGQMNFFDKKTISVIVSNPNNSPVKINLTKGHKQVEVEPGEMYISGQGKKSFSITILAMALEELGPAQNVIADEIVLSQTLLLSSDPLQVQKINLQALQIDMPIKPEEILRPITFGEVFLKRRQILTFSWTNYTSLPKGYSLSLVPFAEGDDIFGIVGGTSSPPLEGLVQVKDKLEVPLFFKPIRNISYEAYLKLILDGHEFNIQLLGTGSDYKVFFKPEPVIDLGIVDAERTQVFELSIWNDCMADLENLYLKISEPMEEVVQATTPPAAEEVLEIKEEQAKDSNATAENAGEPVVEEKPPASSSSKPSSAKSEKKEAVPTKPPVSTSLAFLSTVNPDKIAVLPAKGKQNITCQLIPNPQIAIADRIGKETNDPELVAYLDVFNLSDSNPPTVTTPNDDGTTTTTTTNASAAAATTKETMKLSQVRVKAMFGHCKFQIKDFDPEKGIHFPVRFSEGKSQKITLDVENVGDTKVFLEIVMVDPETGEIVRFGPNYLAFGNDDLFIQFNPFEFSILSGQVKSFTVIAKGEKAGLFSRNFILQTKQLIPPIQIPLIVSGEIESNAVLDGIRAFIKNDRSLDNVLNSENLPENQYPTDEYLWKVLRPVVRVGPRNFIMHTVFKKVSIDEKTAAASSSTAAPRQKKIKIEKVVGLKHVHIPIPLLSPNISDPMDISAFTVRPPALQPKEMVPPQLSLNGKGESAAAAASRNRWFSHRVPLRFADGDKQRGSPTMSAAEAALPPHVAMAPEPVKERIIAKAERQIKAEEYFKGKDKFYQNPKGKKLL